ncbi:MAG: GNAT family N-acetyltransferase [Propionibacteriaceae bacterium]
MPLQISPTTAADLPDLLELWNDGAVMLYVGFPDGLGETTESLAAWFHRLEQNRLTGLTEHFIIRDDDCFCGEAYYYIDTDHGHLGRLDIKLTPTARGKGIAAAGLSKAIDEAFTHGAMRVYVDPNPANAKALALYDRLGFQRVDPPPHIAASCDVDFNPIYMELTPEQWHNHQGPEADADAPPLSEIPRGEYAYPGPLRDALIDAILNGTKTSTTCLLAEFDEGEDPRDEVGTLAAVVDSSGEIVCVTRTTDVQIVRLGDVTLEHAIAEGEGYTTIADWRSGHEQFWRSPEFIAGMGELELTDDTMVVCYRSAIDPRYLVHAMTPDNTTM